jgi:MFS family permease
VGPAWREHLTDPTLRPGFLVGFFVLFAFLGVFTYMNFHLTRAGFGLTMAQLGLIHFVFLPSIVTTPLSALLTERLSHRVALCLFLVLAVAGLPLLLSDQILYVAAGLCLVAIGTFAAQAAATGFIGAAARENRNAASGLYLAFYYIGGLSGTAIIGLLYDFSGWTAAIGGVFASLLLALWCASKMRLRPVVAAGDAVSFSDGGGIFMICAHFRSMPDRVSLSEGGCCMTRLLPVVASFLVLLVPFAVNANSATCDSGFKRQLARLTVYVDKVPGAELANALHNSIQAYDVCAAGDDFSSTGKWNDIVDRLHRISIK